VDAIVDTGTSISVFSEGFAEALGLDLSRGEQIEINTQTGLFHAKSLEIMVEFENISLPLKIGFGPARRNLLGLDFLSKFIFSFLRNDIFTSPINTAFCDLQSAAGLLRALVT